MASVFLPSWPSFHQTKTVFFLQNMWDTQANLFIDTDLTQIFRDSAGIFLPGVSYNKKVAEQGSIRPGQQNHTVAEGIKE